MYDTAFYFNYANHSIQLGQYKKTEKTNRISSQIHTHKNGLVVFRLCTYTLNITLDVLRDRFVVRPFLHSNPKTLSYRVVKDRSPAGRLL